MILLADNGDPDQTADAQADLAFAARIYLKTRFRIARSIYSFTNKQNGISKGF